MLACACGSSSGAGASTDGGGDASDDASAVDASDDASAADASAAADAPSMCVDAGAHTGPITCNGLRVVGAPVTPVALGAIAPKGGAIVDGSYVLTSFAVVGGDVGTTYRQRLVVCGSTLQVVKELDNGGVPSTSYATSTFALSGATITLNPSCGSYWDGANGYDATPSTLVIYGQGTHALTFSRE